MRFTINHTITILLHHTVHSFEDAHTVHYSILTPPYNPEIISDRWRKIDQRDFDNIGDFAQRKCDLYNPDLPGEIEVAFFELSRTNQKLLSLAQLTQVINMWD